jgi:type I restriction enzyme R subunit
VRKAQEITVDVVTLDEVTKLWPARGPLAGLRRGQGAGQRVRDVLQGAQGQLDALSVLYSRPYAQRLTRKQLMELLAAIQRPPRQWTSEALWAAYERWSGARARGVTGPHADRLISLARHAMGVEAELVSYADQAAPAVRSVAGAAGQHRGGRSRRSRWAWLELIRDRIVVDLEVRQEDFEDTPFVERGLRARAGANLEPQCSGRSWRGSWMS